MISRIKLLLNDSQFLGDNGLSYSLILVCDSEAWTTRRFIRSLVFRLSLIERIWPFLRRAGVR